MKYSYLDKDLKFALGPHVKGRTWKEIGLERCLKAMDLKEDDVDDDFITDLQDFLR